MTWLSNEVVDRLREVATWPELPSDRYVIRGPIGRGGMGTVYAARDELLDRDVALKVSNSAVVESDLEQRLQQEARVLARLEHPGIVPVHDAGILGDGRLFYVMKLVRGRTLTEALDGRRDETLVLSIFERIAETVAFAHAAGIVHRDLKPSNVMICKVGLAHDFVKVLDFGLAKVIAGGDITVRNDLSVFGYDGGFIVLEAGGAVIMQGADASGRGDAGSGGCVDVLAGAGAELRGLINVTGARGTFGRRGGQHRAVDRGGDRAG